MKILITGVSSTIGINLSQRLIEQGHTVVGFDMKEAAGLPQNVIFVKGDIRSLESVTAAAVGCEAGIHLAVIADDSQLEEIMSINVGGAYSFLQAAKNAQFRNSIIASSAPVHLPQSELDNEYLLRTSEGEDSVYDLTKTLQEVVGRDFHAHGLPVQCLRFGHLVRGEEAMNMKRTAHLKDVTYCRGGWVALEDVVDACAAALRVTPNSETFEILNVVGARGARDRFRVAEMENRLGIKLRYDFADYE